MNFQDKFTLHDRTIHKSETPFIVAEIGLNHNNDLEIAKKTIQAAKKAGADAVKFQSYITDEFIDPTNAEAKFLFDIFKQYELTESMHRAVKKTADEEGIVFFSTPLCNSIVDLLVDLKVPVLKIASGDIVNASLLKKCASAKLPLFVSTGAADFYEVVRAVEYLDSLKADKLCLMHCVSLYPTPIDKLNLNTINLYSSMYNFPIGFSDHSAGTLGASIAVAYDACVIEKHFTLDRALPGPDHGISVNPDELKELVVSCRSAFEMKGSKEKILTEQEFSGRFYGRRSLYKNPIDKEPIALRPALHTKDKSVREAWEYVDLDFTNNSYNGNYKPLKKQ